MVYKILVSLLSNFQKINNNLVYTHLEDMALINEFVSIILVQ